MGRGTGTGSPRVRKASEVFFHVKIIPQHITDHINFQEMSRYLHDKQHRLKGLQTNNQLIKKKKSKREKRDRFPSRTLH